MRRPITLFILSIFLRSTIALHVSIYYAALCSDSVDFITQQLYPHYEELKDHLTIDFIPYGKTMHGYNARIQKYIFNCQHGVLECNANTYQACALAQANDQDSKVKFVNCVMSARNPAKISAIKKCVIDRGLDFDKVQTCTKSSEGEQLQVINGNKTWTLEPNIYEVPTVILNGDNHINGNTQARALADFTALVCSNLEEPKPEVCQKKGLLRKIKDYFS
ncbi:GILT-like protein 1 [Rhynchophorus ferrugineus]|uniref:Uncharacterized protein n=1 Tax=Rhynchophorus ferrugineus TaxID=354439 RepID=A0A834HQQ4_RHYFE|nr:hypothetical protein GWI33_019839 [Rhynchophorus ferrugineus]